MIEACRGQKRVSDTFELELQVVVWLPFGFQSWLSERENISFNCWLMSPVPPNRHLLFVRLSLDRYNTHTDTYAHACAYAHKHSHTCLLILGRKGFLWTLESHGLPHPPGGNISFQWKQLCNTISTHPWETDKRFRFKQRNWELWGG